MDQPRESVPRTMWEWLKSHAEWLYIAYDVASDMTSSGQRRPRDEDQLGKMLDEAVWLALQAQAPGVLIRRGSTQDEIARHKDNFERNLERYRWGEKAIRESLAKIDDPDIRMEAYLEFMTAPQERFIATVDSIEQRSRIIKYIQDHITDAPTAWRITFTALTPADQQRVRDFERFVRQAHGDDAWSIFARNVGLIRRDDMRHRTLIEVLDQTTNEVRYTFAEEAGLFHQLPGESIVRGYLHWLSNMVSGRRFNIPVNEEQALRDEVEASKERMKRAWRKQPLFRIFR